MSPLIPEEETVPTFGTTRRHGNRSRRTSMRGTLQAGLLVVALLSACVVAAGTAAASNPLGALHPASLSAVTIGLISDGGGTSSIGTAGLVEQGAKAAV